MVPRLLAQPTIPDGRVLRRRASPHPGTPQAFAPRLARVLLEQPGIGARNAASRNAACRPEDDTGFRGGDRPYVATVSLMIPYGKMVGGRNRVSCL